MHIDGVIETSGTLVVCTRGAVWTEIELSGEKIESFAHEKGQA